MDYLSASEIVIGLIMSGKINALHVPPHIMYPPYDRALDVLREGGSMANVIDKIGVEPTMIARTAASAVDPEQDWIEVLKLSATREVLADTLEKEIKRLRKGGDPDAGAILGAYGKFVANQTNYVTLDEVDPDTGAWVGADYPPLDIHLDGIPQGGLTVIGAPPGIGKCHGKGTPIVLHSGEVVPVERIKVGDMLMGADSSPRCVASITAGRDEMFRVQPIKGDAFVCNADHILVLVHTDTDRIVEISIRDYLSGKLRDRNRYKLFRVGVEFPHRDTIIPPYIFGVWLGDGTASKPEIAMPPSKYVIQDEITTYVKESGGQVAIRLDKYKCPTLRMNGNHDYWDEFKKAVDSEGMKSIPHDYLYTDRQSRLELLAGLIDTDGYLGSGCYEITTKSDSLNRDILYLARSLGFAATSRKKVGRIRSIGFSGIYNRIIISGDIDQVPCRLEKRIALSRKQIKNVLRTGFMITPVGVDDYYGFTLDGDGRYLLGDFTVTHNTSLLMRLLGNKARLHKYTLLYTLEMMTTQICWRLVQSMGLSKEERSYIVATDAMMNVDRLYAEATQMATKYPLSLIGIDFADLLNEGEEDDKKIGYIYRRCAELAKKTTVPVVLLSPLSRNYVGGLPRIHHLRYSSMAEHMAALVLLLYNPNNAFIDSGSKTKDILPTFAGTGYLIVGKSRFGYKMGSIGAIAVGWDNDKGIWSDDISGWYPLTNI